MRHTKTIFVRPGVVKDDTEIAAEPRYTDSNRIRFVKGLPQKLGGWEDYLDGAATFLGAARSAFEWTDNAGITYVVIGTHKKLYALTGASLTNITPVRAQSANLTDPFDTTDGSRVVTVNDTSHGAAVGDYVEIANADPVGGITPDGNYEIKTVPDADSYTIEHSAPATSTATGGGMSTVDIDYEIQIGREHGGTGAGYGLDGYGSGTYGTARTNFVLLYPRVWTFDQWGQNVLCQVLEGNLYQWDRNLANRATVVTNAPTDNLAMFVTDEKIVVCIGADGDRTLVQWNDRDDLTNWTVSALTTAGSRNLAGSSRLVATAKGPSSYLILGDSAVWTMAFIGGEDVFGFDREASRGAGAISPIAVVEQAGILYWMGQNDFYMWDGRVRPIPHSNDVRQFVFTNLARIDAGKCFAVPINQFGEIFFFYPTSQEIDRYVKVNLRDAYANRSGSSSGVWDVGALARTGGLDAEEFNFPLLFGTDGIIYKHETGNDDGDDAMGDYIVMSPTHLPNLQGEIDIYEVLPDFKSLSGDVEITLKTREYPQASEVEDTLEDCDSSTEILSANASGRQVGFKIASKSTGSHWRYGSLTIGFEKGGDR